MEESFATRFTSKPGIFSGLDVEGIPLSIPEQVLSNGNRQEMERISAELYEWLCLVRLDSPRIRLGDKIDRYLSRFEVPQESASNLQICRLTWQGFISPRWLRQTLIALLSSCPTNSWFCLSATEFPWNSTQGSDEMVLLQPAGSSTEYLLMEIKSPE